MIATEVRADYSGSFVEFFERGEWQVCPTQTVEVTGNILLVMGLELAELLRHFGQFVGKGVDH